MRKSRESIEHVTERFAHNGNESRVHFFLTESEKKNCACAFEVK